MKMLFLIIGIALVALILVVSYFGIRLYLAVRVSKDLIASAVPYTKEAGDFRKPMLVIGDSTAVGVGADGPEDTLAALTAEYVNATNVENYAISGAVIEDLPSQIARARANHYDLILLQIGANNIVRGDSAAASAQKLESILKTLPEADTIVMVSAGDIGGASIIPAPLRPFYTKRTLAYHAAFEAMAAGAKITYVNLYKSPSREVITDQPETYLAADGFHLSSAGYELWFEAVKPSL